MAGATNRAFKAAGIPKAAIKELRVTGGRGLTLRSAISLAGERGIQIPQKAHDFLLMRVVNMSIGKVDTKGLNKNPYERPAQESVAKYDRREKARERAKREKQAAADAARRSNDFWYR